MAWRSPPRLRVWQAARLATFSKEVQESPLAQTPYDLRHACVSTWLNGGVPPTQVADWAGHSVEVLLKIYAKCFDGQYQIARRRRWVTSDMTRGDPSSVNQSTVVQAHQQSSV